MPADPATGAGIPRASRSGPKILAHRGVHQTFDREGVDDQTCTAERIDPPTHDYIENTVASMEAAFAAGASVVEIDIALTADEVLAVFHDWEVECRTDGTGEIRSLPWDTLSKLDVGFGYTADGESYPLRGRGIGLMPRLEEVFAAFPDGQFLINFKSNDITEADRLREVVERADAEDQVWAVYGAPTTVDRYVSATSARGFTEESVRACLAEYLTNPAATAALAACENTVVVVPLDLAPALEGWPDQLVRVMANSGSHVILSGPGFTGIDTAQEFDQLPDDLNLYVWTDKVDALDAAP